MNKKRERTPEEMEAHRKKQNAYYHARRKRALNGTPEEAAAYTQKIKDRYQRRKEIEKIKCAEYRKKNAERLRLWHAENYRKNREAIIAAQKAAYRKRFEAIRQRSRLYYLANRQKRLAYNKEHPMPIETRNAYTATYRARKRGNNSTGANMKWIRGLYQMADRVTKCTGIRYSVDHIVPISRGGPHHQDNLQLLPLRVNIRKAASLPLDADRHYKCLLNPMPQS